MTLPIALSVPHAGLLVPEELRADYLLSEEQTIADGDTGAFRIYDLRDDVAAFVRCDVARAVLDMNRAADDTERADGVFKTLSIWGEPIWRRPLSADARRELLARYHAPYHRALRAFVGRAKLAVDCHTMSDVGPPIGPDVGCRRPLVCIGDRHGATCPRPWVEALQQCLARYFGDDVTCNEPFAGGYITATHGADMPWVQLELSRTDDLSVEDKADFVRRALRDWCRLDLAPA